MKTDRWRCPECRLLVCEFEPDDGPLRLGEVAVDGNTLTIAGQDFALTPGQAEVMRVLIEGAGRVRSFEVLAEAYAMRMSMDEYETDPRTRAKIAVWHIKQRIGEHRAIIESINTRGFRLRPPQKPKGAPS